MTKLWSRFTTKNIKLLTLSKLALILVLLSLGLINYGIELKEQVEANKILNSNEPDYILEAKIVSKTVEQIFTTEHKIENLTDMENINEVLFYRELMVVSSFLPTKIIVGIMLGKYEH